MPHLGEVMAHVRLVLRMGRATGADIVAAHRNGHLSQQDWARMIRSCQGCACAHQCPDWLDEHETAFDAPERCPNRARFAALKAAGL